jgi:hypothetical protein
MAFSFGQPPAAPGAPGTAGLAAPSSVAPSTLSDSNLKNKTLAMIFKSWDGDDTRNERRGFTDDYDRFQSTTKSVLQRDKDMIDCGNALLELNQSIDQALSESKATQKILEEAVQLQKALAAEVEQLEKKVEPLSKSHEGKSPSDETRESMYDAAIRLFDQVQQVEMATSRLMEESNQMRAQSRSSDGWPMDAVVATLDWHFATIGKLQAEADKLQLQLRRAGLWMESGEDHRGLSIA